MKETDNVRVAVRCRPLNEKEISTGCKTMVKVRIVEPPRTSLGSFIIVSEASLVLFMGGTIHCCVMIHQVSVHVLG